MEIVMITNIADYRDIVNVDTVPHVLADRELANGKITIEPYGAGVAPTPIPKNTFRRCFRPGGWMQPAENAVMPIDPLACPKCGKVCKSALGLRSHVKACTVGEGDQNETMEESDETT
jgi:hypothetical protein